MDRSIKAARLADQIRDYFSLWLHREYLGKDFSITQVTLTPDLRIATVWVDTEDSHEVFSQLIKSHKHWQHLINHSLNKKHFLEIEFKKDESREIGATLDSLLKG